MNIPDFLGWLDYEPYSLNAKQKSDALTQALTQLTEWHTYKCAEYRKILDTLGVSHTSIKKIQDIPFIPARLFKELDLLSTERINVFKTMTSSGTAGQQVSRIYLDKENAALQTKVLSRLVTNVLGKKRIPMLVIDSPTVVKDRSAFSARGAGVLGFSMFGQDVTYALDEAMHLDVPAVQEFLQRHPDSPIFVFGFTFMIWQYLVCTLRECGQRLPLERAIVLHGGGWKKLQDQAVDNPAFRLGIGQVTGAKHVVNYYGMVEQTGSIYMECEQGHLHTPIYSDVVVRRPHDFSTATMGEEGIIEVLSILPRSYPGHALLTEDCGVILGEDDCACGRLGKYFHVRGRLESAEVRGCSDTHEAHS